MFFYFTSLNRWFSVRLNFISIIFTLLAMFFVILNRSSEKSGIDTGLLLLYLIWVQQNILWMTWNCINLEKGMVSFEWLQKVMEIQTEKFGQGNVIHSFWPKEGAVEFKNYMLKYWENTELVLKGISFKINPKEKIGIVGRTGAGKSTICLALCRMIEAYSG